jgi:hypothetical protein
MTTKVARIRLENNALNRVWSLGNRNPVQPNSCPNPATMKNIINTGKILNSSFRSLMVTDSPLKIGLNNEPMSITGTMNKTAKIQYPIPTRQTSTRFSNFFTPAIPSNIAVMMIPEIGTERTEDNASSAGIIP